ncbi:MAG: hypothetical protein WEB33_05690 [Bacteroidota bacterium]
MTIGIDGFSGVGKTPTAQFLANELRAKLIHLDPFFVRDGRFAESFKVADFRRELDGASGPRLTIIEGILLADILSKAERALDCSIYVKRIGRGHLWYDRNKLERNPEELSKLDQAIVAYHHRVKPHETSAIILELEERPA